MKRRVKRMKIKAAVLYQYNEPLVVDVVDLDPPQAGEALVKLVGCGLCHTDLSAAQGAAQVPTPAVLGHEGAGIVQQIGPGVTRVSPGDHVVLTGSASCGQCRYCVRGIPSLCDKFRPVKFTGVLPGNQRRLSKDGQALSHFFVQSAFAEYAVVPQEAAIKIREDAPLDIVGILGCSALTGISSVINSARVEAGTDVAVIGCGGVGLSSIMGARLVGAGNIIAVDIRDSQLEMARELGATHSINARRENVIRRIKEITDGGADYTFWGTDNTDALVQSIIALRPGGTCILMAGVPAGTTISFDRLALYDEKTIRGCRSGTARASIDIPVYVNLFMDGRLPIDRLVTHRYRFDEINTALQGLQAGEIVKSVIVF